MTTLAQEDPARAIRNALERIERMVVTGADQNTVTGRALLLHVQEERALVELALRVLAEAPRAPVSDADAEGVRRCSECTREYVAPLDEEGCPYCDLFAPG